MTVRELMEILEMFDEDAEVKLAYQPSWPLCTAVASVKKKDGVVYVCESGYGGNDYAPHCLFESDEYVDLDEGDRGRRVIFRIARLTMARWPRAETPRASREARNIFEIREASP